MEFSKKDREVKTVMHELKRRVLTVQKTEQITPNIKRITLTGPDLSGFTSLSPDDHMKIFFTYPGESEPVFPSMNPEALPDPSDSARKPLMRDYTPRFFDSDKNELQIEFVLHGEGPGNDWALQAEPGQHLHVAGPRGSRVVPYNFDWYLMIGDETSLPSIARRLEELPAAAKAVVIVEVEGPAGQYPLPSGSHEMHWVYRKGQAAGSEKLLHEKILEVPFPVGDYFSWIATEKKVAFALKELLLTVKGAQEDWIKATGYWNRSGLNIKDLP